MNFNKLTKENLPKANTLVWCKRKDGRIILATRGKNEFSENIDPSSNCYWYGFNNIKDGLFNVDNTKRLEYSINFSDVTVESWTYLEKPK